MIVMVRPLKPFRAPDRLRPLGEHTEAILNEAGDGLEEIEGLRLRAAAQSLEGQEAENTGSP
jgi:hypothetical protein